MSNNPEETVSIIGLGKLGASMAAAMASRGWNVIGVDVFERSVNSINRGESPVSETGLAEMIRENHDRIKATRSHEEAILGSNASFVIVPTPSDPRGAFSIQYAQWAFREIGKALKKKNGYHLIVMTSTVLPGACRYGLIPVLEQESGKKAGVDFGFCYSPEFIALGSVIRDFLNPDFTLVGQWDEKSGQTLENIYQKTMTRQSPCRRMTVENAELAKVALNSYVTMKIAFANTLSEICNRLPGGDVDAVTQAIGNDSRIGLKYLSGGMGFGGPCFPRDNVAFRFIAEQVGVNAKLAQSTDEMNQYSLEQFSTKIKESCNPGSTVAVLGLSYKPSSPVIEASQSIMLCDNLINSGYRVTGYDPLANDNAQAFFNYRMVVSSSIQDCIRGANVVFIGTPDAPFKALEAKDFNICATGVKIFDPWRVLADKLTDAKNVKYVPLGRGDSNDATVQILRELWK